MGLDKGEKIPQCSPAVDTAIKFLLFPENLREDKALMSVQFDDEFTAMIILLNMIHSN